LVVRLVLPLTDWMVVQLTASFEVCRLKAEATAVSQVMLMPVMVAAVEPRSTYHQPVGGPEGYHRWL